MADNIININLTSKTGGTVNFIVEDAGQIQAEQSIIPQISFIPTGEIGPVGAKGENGTAVISDNSVTSAKLANNSVGSQQLIDGSVGHIQLSPGSVYGNRILDNSIDGVKLLDGTITSSKIANNTISEAQIANGSITRALLSPNVVTGVEILDGSIYANQIANNNVVRELIQDNAVGTNEIEDDVTLNGTVTVTNLDLSGSSPATITGPASDALQIKSNSTIDFQNTSGTTIASLDQNGNLTISGTVDGIDINSAITANTAKNTNVSTNITVNQLNNNIEIQSSDGTNGNINVATPSVAGSMSKEDKSKLNTIELNAQQNVQSDWDAVSGDSYINNKPTTITTAQANAITANTAKPDLTVDGAGSIHVNNVPTLNQSTTGNAATATALASGNQTISGDLTIDGDIILDGNQSINSLGASGSLNVNPASVLNLGTASTDSVNIGRQSSTIPVNIYTGTSTASAVLTNSTITLNHPTTINSDLAITGTVDGRDIATDGTKLDGIATGADVTTVTANTTNADFPVVFHDSNALHDDGASDFTYNPSTNNLKIGKLTANSSGSTLAGIVSVGTQDGDDRLHIARYRDTSTIYPFAHIYAGLDGLSSRCGFKIVVRNNSGTLGDGLKIDGNTKEVTFSGVINGTKLNTGQGDNELYAMNQDVETSDNVTFASVTTTGDIQVSGNDIKDSSGTAAITFNGSGFMSTPQLTVNNHAIVSKTLTVGGTGNPAVTIATKKVTLTTAQCNALHTTPVTVAPAAGADTVIVPVSGMIRVDRAATQTNSSADLNFHYSGTTGAYFNSSMVHFRRFMWNETGDRVFNIAPLAIERSQSLTEDVNKDLVVSVDSALTNNCFTSVTIFLTYHVFDIS